MQKLRPTLTLAALGALLAPGLDAQVTTHQVADALRDKSQPGQVIAASSVPHLGALLPLGPYFHVTPVGRVGIGTVTPATTLDVEAGSAGGFQVRDGSTELFGLDAGTTTLTLGLTDWNVNVPMTVHLPAAAPAWNFRAPSGLSVLSIDALNRRVGISGGAADASAPLYPLHVQHNATDDNYLTVARILTDVVTSADTSAYYYGTNSTARVPLGSYDHAGGLVGMFGDATHMGDGDMQDAIGAGGAAYLGGTGNLTEANGVYAQVGHWGVGTIDRATALWAAIDTWDANSYIEESMGVFVAAPGLSGTINNHYGLYLEDPTGPTNAWALYAEAGDSYFGGNVGLGVTSPSNILTVQMGSATDPVADAWTTYSSRRWKTRIETIRDPLGLVQSLRGVTYDWKSDGRHDVGFIAEEVGEVLPQIVTWEDNGTDARSVDYTRISAVLVEAVKEQQAEIDDLRAELTETRALLEQVLAALPKSQD